MPALFVEHPGRKLACLEYHALAERRIVPVLLAGSRTASRTDEEKDCVDLACWLDGSPCTGGDVVLTLFAGLRVLPRIGEEKDCVGLIHELDTEALS
jgi:hypothetical protein